MIIKSIILFIVVVFPNYINAYTSAHNFKLDEKVDHDYVIGYLGHKAYNCPFGFAVIKLNADVKAPETAANDPTVYLIDKTVNRFLYSRSDTIYRTFGEKGTGLGKFNKPYGIEATADGKIYITEEGNHRISILQNNKGNILPLKVFGGYGTGHNKFRAPKNCAIDLNGNIYVIDSGNNQIKKFNSSGDPICSFNSGQDNFFNISRYAYGITIGKNDNIYACTISGKICKYSKDGIHEKTILARDSSIQSASLFSLESVYYGNIYAVDRNNCQIHVFDPDLNYIYTFGEYGTSGTGKFDDPRDIAIWKDYGYVIITEKTGLQIYYIVD